MDSEPNTSRPLTVALVPMPDFSLMAFSTVVDVLRHAADEHRQNRQIRCRWEVLSQDRMPIQSSGGLAIQPSQSLDIDLSTFDYVIVVGGSVTPANPFNDVTIDFLRRARNQARKGVVAMCTAVYAFAQSGLLEGRSACVSWLYQPAFAAQFPEIRAVSHKLFEEDDGLFTCGGGAAAADLALQLVERHLGSRVSSETASLLLMSGVRKQDEAPYVAVPRIDIRHEPRIRKVILLMQESLSTPLTTKALARSVDLSERQLSRLFLQHVETSPSAYYRDLRLEHTRDALKRTNRAVDEIAQDGGFADSSHFCRAFREKYATSPSKYRALHRQGLVSPAA